MAEISHQEALEFAGLDSPMCWVCNESLSPESIARREDGSVRLDAFGNTWCQDCTDEFDKYYEE